MAEGEGYPKPYSKRSNTAKTSLVDSVKELKIRCENCQNMYKNKYTLATHQKKCTPLTAKDSFFKQRTGRNSYDVTAKILPASQELNRTCDTIQYVRVEDATSATTPTTQHTPTYAQKVATKIQPVSKIASPSNRMMQSTRIEKMNTASSPIPATTTRTPLEHSAAAARKSPTPTTTQQQTRRPPHQQQQARVTPAAQKAETTVATAAPQQQHEQHRPPKIFANLPAYTEVPILPTKPYKNITPDTFVANINSIYEDVVSWKKNIFQLPNGKSGKAYIKLVTEWMTHFNTGTCFQGIAMKVTMVLPSLLLQKPSAKSKAKEHNTLLIQRLDLWEAGKLTEIWKEGKTIQKKLVNSSRTKSKDDITRIFSRLMLEGKVGPALKFLDEQAENAVLKPTEEVIRKLQSLHPSPVYISEETLYAGPIEEVNPAIFYSIDEQEILKAARRTNGSGGPSLMDANQWRRILTSKKFKAEGKDLREELATFAKKIATEVLDPKILESYTAGRLIPLNKSPGDAELQVRPIGVGEVMRRIVGKTISWCLSSQIQETAGPLQVSAGVKGGAEAAIHAMKQIYELESTDAVILVDAANAFNRLNRQAALHNMQYLCPAFAIVLINTYRSPSRLFIVNGGEILSTEGTTQGDALAMQFYGISITPIMNTLKKELPSTSQVWLADDATGAGRIDALLEWWKLVIQEGEKYGYYVKPSKSWLILKDPLLKSHTETLFQHFPIKITTDGKRHLGASLGTETYKTTYINEKVAEWCKRITNLSEIAKSQPHAAYSAYIHGEQHRYTYFARTISGISENLKPLDNLINEKFVPALFGREVTDNEREVLALPVKEGGLGLRTIHENSSKSYQTSKSIAAPLIKQIINQSDHLPSVDDVKKARSTATQKLKKEESKHVENIKNKQSATLQRKLEQTSEPGASSWLGALPVSKHGFDLHKNEFHDALNLRYNKPLKNLPSQCPCGAKFDTTHALNCHKGGFVNARHDNIRNLEANLLKQVCNDVEIEPGLQIVTNKDTYPPSAIVTDDARLDVRARGFWRQGQNAFFDVCVTNPDCDSQISTSMKSVLRKHETKKKRQYNRRVMEVEHGTLTPLIFTTSGVMGHECQKYHKSLADKLCNKRGEEYSDVMRYIRVKISFLVLKATLLCLRGSRSMKKNEDDTSDDISLTLHEIGM